MLKLQEYCMRSRMPRIFLAVMMILAVAAGLLQEDHALGSIQAGVLRSSAAEASIALPAQATARQSPAATAMTARRGG